MIIISHSNIYMKANVYLHLYTRLCGKCVHQQSHAPAGELRDKWSQAPYTTLYIGWHKQLVTAMFTVSCDVVSSG